MPWRPTTPDLRRARILAAVLGSSLIFASPMTGDLVARQTPVPRVVANPALKAKADSLITRTRAGAAQYDQAVAAIGRLAAAPIATDAQVKALRATLETNLKIIQEQQANRLLLIALTDASLKQGVEAAAIRQGGKALLADIRSGGLDRIGGVNTVRIAMARRAEEDGRTLKRAGEALRTKTRQAGSGSGGGGGGGGGTITTRPPAAQTSAFDPIVAAAIHLFTLFIENVSNPPEDTPPPPVSTVTRCLEDAFVASVRCFRDAGINPIKQAICAAEELLAFAACMGVE